MTLTVTTAAPKTRLTTVARVKAELGITASTDDTLLGDLVDRASAAIVSYCHRVFAREAIYETMGGFGDIHMQLGRTPIAGTPSTVYQNEGDTGTGTLLTDWSVGDKMRGWLYRRLGWTWTAQRNGGLMASGGWLDNGFPLANQEEPQFQVTYVAGYLMPEQNMTPTTVSVSSTDNSFNDSASGFPSLLKAGDVIVTSGFATAANNSAHVVSGTPTIAKVVVTSTLVTESAPVAATSIIVQNLPADLEKACIDTTKFFYLKRKQDPTMIQRQLNVAMERFEPHILLPYEGFPPTVIGLLRPWVRAV